MCYDLRAITNFLPQLGENHLQFVILLFYDKFPSYLCMTSSLKYIKCLQNVSCHWSAKLECKSKKTLISYDCVCFENCHETITLTNKPQNFVIFLNLTKHCTEVRFSSFLSSGFTTMKVINSPESNLAKRTSVHWFVWKPHFFFIVSICILVFVFSK